MKQFLMPSIRLTVVMLGLCGVLYFGLITLLGKLAPGGGGGETITVNGKIVGYERVGQSFTSDRYFWGRPSAINYNAAGSAGSNKGPSNPAYLATVQERLDSFLVHHPGVRKDQVPSELITASGSGLDPHISPASAYLQVDRVARARGLSSAQLKSLVGRHVETNAVGPDLVDVLKLNIALDQLQQSSIK